MLYVLRTKAAKLYQPPHKNLYLFTQMENKLNPRTAAKFIVENSRHVKLLDAGISALANHLVSKANEGDSFMDITRWQRHELNPKTSQQKDIDWVFLSDVLNFSFWSDDISKKYGVQYAGKLWTGYWSLCAAINRAIYQDSIPFTDPKFFRTVTKTQLQHIFRSDTDCEIPMFDNRLQVLHEAGQVLCEKYDGSFVNMIKASNQSAQALLQLIVKEIASFQDETMYKNQTVCLWKRAQILVADVWACCQGQGYGTFHDIDTITMFADYRIPQALVWFKAMEYSEELLVLLNKGHMFNSGDEMEVEIRGCSIEAVERIVVKAREILGKQGTKDKVNAITVDHFLWDYRREHAEEVDAMPFHKVRCHFY